MRDLDGGIMILGSEVAGEQNMAIEDGPYGIGDRIVKIVIFNEHRIQSGDAPRPVIITSTL